MPTNIAQLLQLLDAQEARIRRAFLQFVQVMRSDAVIAELTELLKKGDVQGAFRVVDSYVARFSNAIPEVINAVGVATATELDRALSDVALAIVFDATHPRAAALAAASRTNLIREFTAQQQAAAQQAISRAISNGLGTAEMARAFRNSIGLTAAQEQFIETYRRQLEALDRRSLDRELRDRRFDDRVATAITRDRPLTVRQIDMMVDRYRARAIMMRAETISRTEALTAYSQAREESVTQMMTQAAIPRERVVRIWYATHDARVREWHASMDGQRREPDEPFTDGLGNRLRYPGDPFSPGETRINCRCTLGFEVIKAA